jgi:hypothetical protein
LRPDAVPLKSSTRTEALTWPAATLAAEVATHARPALTCEPASHAAGHSAAAHGRDSLPRLRLLVRCKDSDRIAAIRQRLLAHAIHLRTHLLHPLTHSGSSR